jgi:hypothetical protein
MPVPRTRTPAQSSKAEQYLIIQADESRPLGVTIPEDTSPDQPDR